MYEFRRALKARQPTQRKERSWVFVSYDQLSDRIGPLAHEPAESLGILLVESPWKARRRPYHQQKLAAVLANLRHFALEQAERGVAVEHVVVDGPYREAVGRFSKKQGPLRAMRPAERELRADLAPLVRDGTLEVLPHEGWLTSSEDFKLSQPRPPYRMDRFYRHVRARTGLLMTEGGKPLGGRWSFDSENRKRWPGTPPAPELPRFEPDPITEEVGRLVTDRFGDHPGKLDLSRLPSTAAHAQSFWRWAKERCLPFFGPFEDAMSARSRNLFHSRLSLLINLGRLLPGPLVEEVAGLSLPLSSKEGFIRQILGWREFMHHVHELTDGFRRGGSPSVQPRVARDGGYAHWTGKAWPAPSGLEDEKPTATPSALGAKALLPPLYWGAKSGLRCADTVIEGVWDEGYSHHITRLMVLSNLAQLLESSPRQLTDWFWVAYVDAYDWVVEPNVLAMGTWSEADLVVTKPYAASANYIDKMSDFCGDCRFDPKKNCPFTSLYWAFLERHRSELERNPRLFQVYRLLARRDSEKKAHDAEVFSAVQKKLLAGEELWPD